MRIDNGIDFEDQVRLLTGARVFDLTPHQIFQAARCWQQLQINTCLPQDFTVSDTQLVVGAPLGASGHNYRARW